MSALGSVGNACELGVRGCHGGALCMHDCYRERSREAMRAACEYASSVGGAPDEWRARLDAAIEARTDPRVLAACGVTGELLAYCGVSIEQLVLPRTTAHGHESHYYVEHLVGALKLTCADLRLLGLGLHHLADRAHFPLIALYDAVGFRAADLFAFHMSYADLERTVLRADERHAELLRLNLDYWRAALTQAA